MKKKRIMELLYEAANTDDWRRQNAIHIELQHETAHYDSGPDGDGFDSRAKGIEIVISALYVETLSKFPHKLPSLWPVFVLACGDRTPGLLISEVYDDVLDPSDG